MRVSVALSGLISRHWCKGTRTYELMPTSVVDLSCVMPYGDAQVLAKQAEEGMLIREIQSDAVHQVVYGFQKHNANNILFKRIETKNLLRT